MNVTDLQALEKELAEKQSAYDKALEKSDNANALYQAEFEKILMNNQELRDLYDEKTKALIVQSTTRDTWKAARAGAAIVLADYFDEKPEDKDLVDAFSYRMEKSPLWACAESERVGEILKAGATFLLKVDEKAVSTFVKNMATKSDELYHMPSPIRSWLRVLAVETVTKPTISDSKLKVQPTSQ